MYTINMTSKLTLQIGLLSLVVLLTVSATSLDLNIPSPCTLITEDQKHVYDLSELGEKDYWTVEETLRYSNYNLKFYISVCHPLRNLPTLHCTNENSSGICVEKLLKNKTLDLDQRFVKLITPNAGLITETSIKVGHAGWLEYTYSNGTDCEKNGRPSSYTTTVNFLCPPHNDDETPGPILMSFVTCEFLFAWMTHAACPKKYNEKEITTCVDKFLNSDEILNLHTLHSLTAYNTTHEEHKYQLNICGAIESGPCAGKNATVCDVTDSENPVILSKTSDMAVMWHVPYFTLHYNSNHTSELASGEKEVIIHFVCDRQAHNISIVYISGNDTHIKFAAKSAAVCTPQKQNCILEDRKGNVYDLRKLYKEDDNWEILDSREDHRDVLYHMNMCGPVHEVGPYACPRGNIGACQTSMDRQTAYNLGYITSNPVINPDGTITVIYTGGDQCRDGKHARSSRITLVCHEYEHAPVFIEETDSCEYVFTWPTPLACPKHVVESNTCSVEDPLFGYVYDLSPLHNYQRDYHTNDGTHDYFVNICGPLLGTYGDLSKHTAIAITDTEGSSLSGGESPAILTFNDGTLTMDFTNGSDCDGGLQRSSQIIFLCDHENIETGEGLSVFRHKTSCKANFLWRTKHVCPPHTVIDCSVTTDDGYRYNLNPLSTSNINQEEIDPSNDEKYVLNVCRSVVHSKTARCAYDAAACRIDETHNNPSVSIGVVGRGPYIEGGLLKLKYENGDLCNNTHRYQTEIIFQCDIHNYYPYPNIIAKEDCKYIFEWKTKFACAEKVEPVSIIGNCTARKTYSNYVFDLQPLNKAEGYEVSNGNVTILLNVCDKVSNSLCPSGNDGACSTTKGSTTYVSAGKANAELSYSPGTLHLHYIGGSACSNGFNRTTLISFICGAEDSPQGPVLVFVDDDSCTYFVNWHTEYACEFRVGCLAHGYDRSVDLRPLINHNSNYEVTNPANPEDKFYINVCRPLNHLVGINCPAGSASCLVPGTPGAKPLGLGRPLMVPTHGFDDSVMILYTLGSSCITTPGLKYTTRITFVCDRLAGLGTPTYLELTHDCQYQFEWRTQLTCNPLPSAPIDTCHIRHEEARTNIQLSPLYKQGGYRVPFNGTIYHVNVCGAVCGTSGVCTDDGTSYGHSENSQFKWDYGKLKLLYYGGDECGTSLSGMKTTSIYFECDMAAGYGVPEADPIMQDIECVAVFTWKTNLTCLEGIYGDSTSSPSLTTLPPTNDTDRDVITPIPHIINPTPRPASSKHSGPTGVALVLIAFLVIVVVGGTLLYVVRSGLGSRLINRVKFTTANSRYSSRWRVANENANLLDSNPGSRLYHLDGDDDDMININT